MGSENQREKRAKEHGSGMALPTSTRCLYRARSFGREMNATIVLSLMGSTSFHKQKKEQNPILHMTTVAILLSAHDAKWLKVTRNIP